MCSRVKEDGTLSFACRRREAKKILCSDSWIASGSSCTRGTFSISRAKRTSLSACCPHLRRLPRPRPACCSLSRRRYEASDTSITPGGDSGSALLHSLVTQLGHRRNRRHRDHGAVARGGGPARAPAPSDQRDAAGRDVALLRA